MVVCPLVEGVASLVVLSAEGGDHDGQELLECCLDIGGECRSHLGSKNNGQAVSQQLWERTEK